MSRMKKGPVVAFCLFLLVACSHHQPAPVEEHSSSNIDRQLNADGSYDVRPGDTLHSIAFSFGLDHREVAAWNGIPSPFVIYPDQNLRLSAPPSFNRSRGEDAPPVQISAIKSPGQATTRATTSEPTTRPPPTGKEVAPAVTVASPASPPATPPVIPTIQPGQNAADPTVWNWPANGRILRGYVAGDPSRNGLDIAGQEGQPIKASSAGKVVYSGNGLIGYGELIIIKHSERMLSAYAHNKLRLVQEGEQVSAGQKIAEMGRNDQNEQLLHFEIRVLGKPVNPLEYLPEQ